MIGSKVSKRYAKALFELAQERKIVERVAEEMIAIQNLYQQSSDFSSLLESPVIESSEKLKIFTVLLKEKVQSVTFNFLSLLLEKNREDYLPEIIFYFLKIVDESKGIVRGQLITAHPFTDVQKKELKERLDRFTGKKVFFDEQVDSSLIGGFIVRMEDTVIDTSVKNQLTKMREQLITRK